MGGEGSMMAAIKSLQNNRSLLAKRKDKSALSGSYANIKLKAFPKATPGQLEAIKAQLKIENKKALVKNIIGFIVVCLIILVAIHYLF
ncbi:hypothetical protein ACFFU1_09330 [Algibacter miyuki]|uniref:Uncharacterized protein n=1 Tax=Algibacter miyuki TaxID=1306933 RepID=A0ABV5GZP1_9FLAO|nr:hypothetical protein [Algibacter miyuki]MDN3666703.1 hypothetical protein [Algibacter miyuki]